MKAVLEHLPIGAEESFVVRRFTYKYYPTPWHFHPEYEIVLVTESTGKKFIGDKITDFCLGDLALLGSNLPHLYRNDDAYYNPDSGLKARSIIVHFSKKIFSDAFTGLPELKGINCLLERSARGLQINGDINKPVCKKLEEICDLTGFARLMKLFEILHILSESKSLKFISNQGITGSNPYESERMTKVLEYVINNFKNNITLPEAAAIANLSENSFSRYFSNRTKKPFIVFVNEVRLSHACKLLVENQLSITDICFECGFNNLSNFHRRFRDMYNISPLGYRKMIAG
ncbi:AraC family transcriptional regulator [Parafilimonas sp.]|uniref:AraC family transcriptional regulator n=1 Tax=Parafilimonas sp. TaxID=1969739 RepID=UPI0039E30E30